MSVHSAILGKEISNAQVLSQKGILGLRLILS